MTFRALDYGTFDRRVSPSGDCNMYYMYDLLPARKTRRIRRTAISSVNYTQTADWMITTGGFDSFLHGAVCGYSTTLSKTQC